MLFNHWLKGVICKVFVKLLSKYKNLWLKNCSNGLKIMRSKINHLEGVFLIKKIFL